MPAARESSPSRALGTFNVISWNGLAVPAKTPKDVVAKPNREIHIVHANPEVKKRLSDLSLNAQGSTPGQVGDLLASEIRRWSEVIGRTKIAKQ